MSWPTDYTLAVLIAGLLPTVAVVWGALRGGVANLGSLKVVGVLSLWVGYHLSPWLSYLTGEPWETVLLVERHMDRGLLFSTLCMVVFIVGFDLAVPRSQRRVSGEAFTRFIPPIKTSWVLLGAVVVLISFILVVEGFDDIWKSDILRGDQDRGWRPRVGIGERVFHIIRVLHPVWGFLLATVASVYYLQRTRRNWGRRLLLVAVCLLIASFDGFWNFSRGSGGPFLILGLLAVRLRGRRGVFTLAVCLVIVGWFSYVGMEYRSTYRLSGLGYFAEACVDTLTEPADDAESRLLPSPGDNSFDALAPWTRKAAAFDLEKPDRLRTALIFLWNLHPLPSEIVALKPLGASLTEIMGTEGSTGLTTPALAEAYYAWGFFGILFMLPIGLLVGRIERIVKERPQVVVFVALVLVFLAFPFGLHNGARAMTRPILYAFVLLALPRIYRMLKTRRPASLPRAPQPGAVGSVP